MSCFYHGSTTADIKVLNAVSASHTTGAPVVYITPNRAYALFYIRNRDINWVTCGVNTNGVVIYREQCPKQLERLYKGISGYLYCCDKSDLFEETSTRDIWQTNSPVVVHTVEYVKDVYSEIIACEKAGTVNIIRYETLGEAEKQDIYDMMVQYIFKNDLIVSSSAKSCFIRQNFPRAWEFCIQNPDCKQVILDEWQKKRSGK